VLVPLPAPPSGEQIIVTGGLDPNSAFSTRNGYQFLASFGTPEQYRAYGPAAVDEAARLVYVTDYQARNGPLLDVFTTARAYALIDSFNPQMLFPTGVAIDSAAKKVYVADDYGGISIFSTASGHKLVGSFGSDVDGGNSGNNLAVFPIAGRVYVSGCHSGCGVAYGPVLEELSTVPPYTELGSVTSPDGKGPLAIDVAAGRLYVLERGDTEPNYVDVYDTSRNLSDRSLIARIGPVGPCFCGIAVDAKARRLYVIAPNGSPVQVYGLDTGFPFLGSFAGTSGYNIVVAPYAP
jgi:DNA-binding beta-propeller fold protein YncE